MKAYFNINEEYKDIPIILDIKFSDVMDGSADTLSFSFIFSEDISNKISLKQKCNVKILDDNDVLIKQYNMVLTDISCEKNSMYTDLNGYTITVSLKEHTIFLKDCIRTDMRITPSLYPENIYPTLKEALYKVIDNHNIPLFNEKITSVDTFILDKLSEIVCPNLVFKDLSTYDQLADIMKRIGFVPYLESGVLYGLSLQGTRDVTTQIINTSSYSSSKLDGNNYSLINSKVYNILYDEEYVVTPSVFSPQVKYFISDNNKYIENVTKVIPYIEGQYEDYVDVNSIKDYLYSRYISWTQPYNPDEIHIYNKVLTITGYQPDAQATYSNANEYFLELPFNIETVHSMYVCKPISIVTNNHILKISEVQFGWEIEPVLRDNIIEKSYWDNLSTLQKKLYSYYIRGENKIYQPISMIANTADLQGDQLWSKGDLFDVLRQTYYVIKYKPISYQNYSSYDYNYNFNNNINSLPSSIETINLPYKQVSDKQISNILNYEIQKKLDTNYELKYITDDFSILNVQASDIITYNDKKYIISNATFILSNHSVEVSFTLNDNVIINNMISNYQDNVRVSSNLPSETVIHKDIPLFKENILRLTKNNYSITSSDINIINLNNINNDISEFGFNNIGLYETPISEQDLSSSIQISYPFVIEKLKNIDYDKIKTKTGKFNIDYSNTTFYKNITNYPIYLRRATFTYDIVFQPEQHYEYTPIRWENETYVANTEQELVNILKYDTVGFWRYSLPFPNFDIYINAYGFKSGSPILDTDDLNTYVLFYRVYDDGDLFNNENRKGRYYIELNQQIKNGEILSSSTGNIFTINYKFHNTSYIYSKIDTKLSDIITLPIEHDLGVSGIQNKQINLGVKLNGVDPILYNTTQNGAKVKSIGYAFNYDTLPLISDKKYGLILDLGEIPNPYIQYTTMFEKNVDLGITELNKDIEWLSSYKKEQDNQTFEIHKIKKQLSLNTIKYDNSSYYSNIIISRINKVNFSMAKLDFSIPLVISDEYEYVLVKKLNNITTPLFKFKIDENLSSLYLSSIISDSYNLNT